MVRANANESSTKLSFTMKLDTDNTLGRPKMFQGSVIDAPENLVYSKFSMEKRQNKVNSAHSSEKIVELSPISQDTIYQWKMGIKHHEIFDKNILSQDMPSIPVDCFEPTKYLNSIHYHFSA